MDANLICVYSRPFAAKIFRYFAGAAVGGAAGLGAAAGFGAAGGARPAGLAGAAAAGAVPIVLSYKSITSLVMSIVFEAYSTGVFGLLTSSTIEKPLLCAYLSITCIIF